MRGDWPVLAFFLGMILSPIIGLVMAIGTGNTEWLWLVLVPLVLLCL